MLFGEPQGIALVRRVDRRRIEFDQLAAFIAQHDPALHVYAFDIVPPPNKPSGGVLARHFEQLALAVGRGVAQLLARRMGREERGQPQPFPLDRPFCL